MTNANITRQTRSTTVTVPSGPSSWQNGTDTCDNRLTVMAKVTDPLVLEKLKDALLHPRMVKTITEAVSAEVKRALATSIGKAMPLSPGTTLGPYQIESPLGAGGMGEVYKATDTRLDRTVAIKVLPAHVADDPDLRQRFEREAKTISSLNHPHICTLHDIGTQDEIDFLVMEYLDGQTLAHRLEKGALPLDQALTIAIEIADALDKAHRHGIVHRDLKPANIMLTKAGASRRTAQLLLSRSGVSGRPIICTRRGRLTQSSHVSATNSLS